MMNMNEIFGAIFNEVFGADRAEEIMAEMVKHFEGKTEGKDTHWEPKEGETYYFMWGTGKADTGVFSATEKDLMRLAVGNYFKTAEERDEAVEYLKVVTELKAFAYDNNEPINWDDHQERKYKLCWNRETEKVDSTWSRRKITDGIYFSSHEVAMAAVEAVGEDRIKKYYLPM